VWRLVTGAFTPFLVPWWDEAEWQEVDRWLRRQGAAGARSALERRVEAMLGDGWRAWGLSSGRAAIQVALQAFRLPGDSEVLIPSFLCSSVAVAVIQAGLRPVLVDVDEQFNIRLESVLEADRAQVRAVVLPHLSGCWARDAEALVAWARGRGVLVVEDAAQAFGLRHGERLAGTFGDVGVFSSGPGKPIFGPGGGWLVTRSSAVAHHVSGLPLREQPGAEAVRHLRAFLGRFAKTGARRGQRLLRQVLVDRVLPRRRGSDLAGDTNAMTGFAVAAMSDLDAVLADCQVAKLESSIERRRESSDRWRRLLDGPAFDGLRVLPPDGNIHTNLLVAFPRPQGEQQSRLLRRVLWAHGVETEPSYRPLHLRPPFDRLRRTAMPNTERQWRGAFGVPVRPNLQDVDWARIEQALRHAARLWGRAG